MSSPPHYELRIMVSPRDYPNCALCLARDSSKFDEAVSCGIKKEVDGVPTGEKIIGTRVMALQK